MGDGSPDEGSPHVDTLVGRLFEYNHWWAGGRPPGDDLPGAFDPLREYRSFRGDFIYILGAVLSGDDDVVGLSGPPGVGKTTILQQLVRLFVDDDLQRQLQALSAVRTGDRNPEAVEDEVEDHLAWAVNRYQPDVADEATSYTPDRVCYLPLDADATNQIRADEQVTRAVRRYETDVLEGDPGDTDHAILIDDVHAVASAAGSADGGWGTLVESLVADRPARTVLLTAIADLQFERELAGLSGPDGSVSYRIQEITPPKFSDYAQRRHRIYEGDDSEEPTADISYAETATPDPTDAARDVDTYRIRSSPLRGGLYGAVVEDDVDRLWTRLQAARFDEDAAYFDPDRLRRCFREYLLLGGLGSLALPDDVVAIRDPDEFAAALADGYWRAAAETSRDLLRTALHREATSFTSIKNVRNLERLFGWVANYRPVAPVSYGVLQNKDPADDALFAVDRRTLREKYFEPLNRMDVLTPSEEYDNQRPTAVRPVPQDVGAVNAVTGHGVDDVLGRQSDESGDPRLRAELAYIAALDHVVRLTYVINDDWDPKQGVIKYWESDGGELVDFVPRFRGAPVPVAVAYPEDEPTLSRKRAALYEFLDKEAYGDADQFDPPVDDRSDGLETLEALTALDGVGAGTLDALRDRGYGDLETLSRATPSDLTDVSGIGHGKAATIADAVESPSSGGLFQRRLDEIRAAVSSPEYRGELRERTFAEGSDSGRTTTHYHVVDGSAPFGILLTEDTRRLLDSPDDGAIVELPLWEFLAAA